MTRGHASPRNLEEFVNVLHLTRRGHVPFTSRGDHVNSTSLALSSSDAQGLFQLGSLLLYLNYINKKKFRTLALQIDNYKAFFCVIRCKYYEEQSTKTIFRVRY